MHLPRSQLLVTLTVLLLSGCATPGSDDAATDAVDSAPSVLDGPDVVIANTTPDAPKPASEVTPEVVEFSLHQNCGAFIIGVYMHCLDGADPAPTDFMHDVEVDGAFAAVVEAELTTGDDAQLLARAGAWGSIARQEPFSDTVRVVLGPADWGNKTLSVQLWSPQVDAPVSKPLWLGTELGADVTVSVFFEDVDVEGYCVRC